MRAAILQNGGIRLCYHAIVGPGRMPPTDPESIGGISTGISPYSGRVCVPPYLQNAGGASSYIIVRRLPARHISQLLYSYLNNYTKSQGRVFLTYVVDPDNGKVLEVSFRVGINNGDKTLLAIPIEKFYKLEVLIKQRLVCQISDALKAEKQSYALSGDTLF